MSQTAADARAPIRATYRLQLRAGIGFREAEGLVPYLAALGVSHVYCSPYVEARPGSSHGYDVVDPRRLDPCLGDASDYAAFVAALRRHGMGQILDWVPNHVGIAAGRNPWWNDVLAFGPTSPFADFFDIDWTPGRPELRGKVLLPVLARPYGEVLESGELVPERHATGSLVVRYLDQHFPVSAASWGRLLARRLLAPRPEGRDPQRALRGTLAALVSRAGRREIRVGRVREAGRRLEGLIEADAGLRERVEQLVAELRGEAGRPASFDPLHRLLEAQHYRLAYWRVAAEEINYRRFFDINELAAVRMERSEVFDHVHERLFEWIEAGRIDGLRIDHVDGLANPRAYCERLRERFPPDRLHVVVEKILARGEDLPRDWPVDGTTGYEFLNLVNGLFVDREGARSLERLYRAFTGESLDFAAVTRRAKRRVMGSLLASELDGLATALDRIAQGDRHTRDFTLRALRRALGGIVAAFPVYRCYVGPAGASESERIRISGAVREAALQGDDPESEPWGWIERILTGDLARHERSARRRRELQRFVTRFEQYTAPVMAKGLEDTAFYRYHPLLSLNEVGGDPTGPGTEPRQLHLANLERAERHPRALLTTATHDTKRGEDARARIDVLSEWPGAWRREVRTWARRNRRLKRTVDGEPAPARKDEYLLYQTLIGSFPLEPLDGPTLAAYRDRLQAYLEKALREGKERSSWRHPRHAYEQAVREFAAGLLAPGSDFLEVFLPFQSAVAERGVLNSLSQVVLKLTSPGVPDVYQGCEGWDLSLADPDNRRPVDFGARRRTLEELGRLIGEGDDVDRSALRTLCDAWRDGRIKHWVTWRLLRLRQRRPDLFVGAGYQPLGATGERRRNLCGFARTRGEDAVLVAAARLCADLPRSRAPFPLGREAWGETGIEIPAGPDARVWRDVLTGAPRGPVAGAARPELPAADLFEELPVAVLVSEPAST